MKNSIRRLICAALALLLVLGTAGDLRLPVDEQAADESFLTILGLADIDDAPVGRSAYAEEVPPEAETVDAAPASEPAPEAGAADNCTEEPSSTEPTGDAQPAPTGDDQPKPTDDVQPAPTGDDQPKPTDDVQPEPTGDDQPEPTDDVQPETTDSAQTAEPTDAANPETDADDLQLVEGYAHVASGSHVRAAAGSDASDLAVLDAGVVYVARIDDADSTAMICFSHEKLAYTAWADASDLTPLTAEELDALRIPADAPTYGGHALPEPGVRFVLRLSLEACPELLPGDQIKLAAAYSDGRDYPIQWSSSDPAVAEISDDGALTAVSPGAATITASGVCMPASIQIAVSEPESISLSAGVLTIGAGETVTDGLICTVTPDRLSGELRWSSTNTRYVKVDKVSGAITGVRAGSAVVTVSTPSGLRASCKVTVRSAPRSVKLSAGATTLGVGDSAPLSVSFNSGAFSHGIRYAVSDEAVLRVEGGRLYAVAPGMATVTVKTFNNKTASLKITVVPAPESVAFTSDAPVLGVGQTYSLSAAVNSESASAITYAGDNPEVAEVAPDGSVTARSIGSVTVTAAAYNGASASQTLTVVPEPTRIDLSASAATLCVGEKLDEPVVATPDNGMTGGLSFKSSNIRYATVSAAGRVSALRAGSVTITVTAYNGVTAKYSIKIVRAPTRLTLSGAKLLGVGDSAALKVSANSGAGVGHYSLSSSDPGVLEIDPAANRIVGIAPGTATVTVKNFNNRTASLKITVVPAPESVTFTSDAPVLGVGQTYSLSAAVNPESVSAITYSGSDDTIAAVSESGEVTALRKGAITVTAAAYNGVSASQTLTVVPAPSEMEILESPIYLGLGEVLTGAIQLRFDEGSAAALRYRSSNSRYVKADAATGKLTGVRVGSATVTVTTHNGLSKTCKVIVQKAPSKVALRLPMTAFSVGQTQTAQVSVTGRGHYVLNSSDPEVVAVEDGNLLRALREGQVTITAKTYNGKTASAKLRVCPAPTEAYPATEETIVGEGLQIQAEFAVNEGSFATFRYEIADPELAQVDERGCVTGLRRGHTQIIASTHNGLTAAMELEILPAPDSIRFDSGALTLGLGETQALSFTIEPENAVGVYTYSSDNPKVVGVSDDGMLAGMACGTAQITVAAQNGTFAALEVTVVPYSETHSAFCMAHRGASGYCPDNSIEAFKYAAVLGADMVELDVRKTKDGVLVVHHDATLSYKGKKYNIANITMANVRTANPNACTLDEALDCIAQTGMEVMIEFKITGIEAEVLDCVRACGLQSRANYGSFTLSVIDRIKALDPSAKTVYIMNKSDTLNKVVKEPEKYSADFISVSASILTPAVIYRLHLGGKQVVAWTINSRSEIERFIAMGADGITTNFPDYM